MCATADGSFAAKRRADSVLFLQAHKLLDADIFRSGVGTFVGFWLCLSKRHERAIVCGHTAYR